MSASFTASVSATACCSLTVPSTRRVPPSGSWASSRIRADREAGQVTSRAVRSKRGSSMRAGVAGCASTTVARPVSTISSPIATVGSAGVPRAAGAASDGGRVKRARSGNAPWRSRSMSAKGSRRRTCWMLTRSGHAASSPVISIRRKPSSVRSPSTRTKRPPPTSPRTRAVSTPA